MNAASGSANNALTNVGSLTNRLILYKLIIKKCSFSLADSIRESLERCVIQFQFHTHNLCFQFRLNSLPASTLRRYKKFFKLSAKPGLNKQQLVDLASDHFSSIDVDERKIVTYFIYSVKTRKNRLDNAKSNGD